MATSRSNAADLPKASDEETAAALAAIQYLLEARQEPSFEKKATSWKSTARRESAGLASDSQMGGWSR